MSEVLSEQQFLKELEPIVEQGLANHLRNNPDWEYHEYIPYKQGKDYIEQAWDPSQTPLSEVAQSAVHVGILTEDGLPWYSGHIDNLFGPNGAWRAWTGRWTAEEGRHGSAMREYVHVTRIIDPSALEHDRMIQVSSADIPRPTTVADGIAYVTLQELATRVAHRNTGKLLDPVGETLMTRIGKDENHHFLFYRGVTSAALELAPSRVVEAIARQVTQFGMPGTGGIPNFTRHAFRIAVGGVYGSTEYLNEVVRPTLKHWQIEKLENLSPEAEAARELLYKALEGPLQQQVAIEQEKRQKRAARIAETSS